MAKKSLTRWQKDRRGLRANNSAQWSRCAVISDPPRSDTNNAPNKI